MELRVRLDGVSAQRRGGEMAQSREYTMYSDLTDGVLQANYGGPDRDGAPSWTI